jgi:hypothetical protein
MLKRLSIQPRTNTDGHRLKILFVRENPCKSVVKKNRGLPEKNCLDRGDHYML